MSEQTSQPGLIDRTQDTLTDATYAGSQALAALRNAVDRLSTVLDGARRSGTPLDIVSKAARQAPLAALFVAFLFGVAAARRR